ncbi:MAG: hypothetical protein OEY93_03465 [Anaerolineae bacterium]|nr:hypothetical protein [Anaerolineae bacterium]
MHDQYHIQLCQEALGEHFAPQALEAITAANLRQDGLFTGLVGRPEFHFDDNKIEESWAYIAEQRQVVIETLKQGAHLEPAWQAFGRLCHCAQDYYSHSNYIRLWLQHHSPEQLPQVSAFNGLDENILHHPAVFTAKVYYPVEALTYFPIFRPWARRSLPADSHAVMNLDEPAMGPLFAFAMEGARQITKQEYDRITTALTLAQTARFNGK